MVVPEKYYCGRLLNAAFGRLEKPYLLCHKIADKGAEIIQSHEDAVLLVDDEHYQVASGQLDGIEYDVHCDVGCCSCYSGHQGGFCKHQAVVHIKFRKSFPNCSLLSADDKIGLYTIATGNHSEMPSSFFAPMSDIDAE